MFLLVLLELSAAEETNVSFRSLRPKTEIKESENWTHQLNTNTAPDRLRRSTKTAGII